MSVTRIADIGEYLHLIWFSKKAIVNILSLKDAIELYRVLYDSEDKKNIVHRQAERSFAASAVFMI